MLLFPRLQIGDRESVVGVFGEKRRVVEHDQRQDHLLERDLVHGDAVLGKMRRRIDMGAVLPDHVVIGGVEAVFFDGVGPLGLRIVGRREFGLPEARPHRRRRPEAVRQIDELLCGDGLVGAREVALRGCGRGGHCESGKRNAMARRGRGLILGTADLPMCDVGDRPSYRIGGYERESEACRAGRSTVGSSRHFLVLADISSVRRRSGPCILRSAQSSRSATLNLSRNGLALTICSRLVRPVASA